MAFSGSFFENIHGYTKLGIGDASNFMQYIAQRFKAVSPKSSDLKIKTELRQQSKMVECFPDESHTAIFNTQIKDLDTPLLFVFQCKDDVVFFDDVSANLVFFLVTPQQDQPYHLQALAKLSRMVKEDGFCDKIRGAETEDAIKAIILDNSAIQKAA